MGQPLSMSGPGGCWVVVVEGRVGGIIVVGVVGTIVGGGTVVCGGGGKVGRTVVGGTVGGANSQSKTSAALEQVPVVRWNQNDGGHLWRTQFSLKHVKYDSLEIFE